VYGTSGDGLLDRPAWEENDEATQIRRLEVAPGQRLGPYLVESKIGSGGMGEVFRATDTRLNRVVAIKVLAEQCSKRFGREAKAISALNHPNICQIYDVGPNYLVMEFVDGVPIFVAGQKPLAEQQALPLAIQIVSAMQAAHARESFTAI
jgi:serine/threonine protein kinase